MADPPIEIGGQETLDGHAFQDNKAVLMWRLAKPDPTPEVTIGNYGRS
jgi:hypothetical protein